MREQAALLTPKEQETPKDSTTPGTYGSVNEQGAESLPTRALHKFAKLNQDTAVGDVCWTSIFIALGCCIHPAVPIAVAAVVDVIVSPVRKLYGIEPRTIFTSNAIDAYHHTRENKDIRPTDVLPCGWVGVFGGLFCNALPDCGGKKKKASVATDRDISDTASVTSMQVAPVQPSMGG